MIQHATARDIPGLIKIWESCFTADKKFIENFFTNGFPHSHTFIFRLKDVIISSVSILPCHVKTIENGISRRFIGGYMYAVGTLPEYRNMGYSKLLTEYSKEFCVNKGYSFIVVYPSELNLYPFYNKQGFSQELYSHSLVVQNNPTYKTKNSLISINTKDDLYIAFEKNFKDKTILFDISLVDYILGDIKNKQGKIYKSIEEYIFLFQESEDDNATVDILGSVPFKIFENTMVYKENKIQSDKLITYTSQYVDKSYCLTCKKTKRGLLYLIDMNHEKLLSDLFLLYPIE